MQYGHFDNENREYVIDRVDLPTSWTNYIGVKDMCAVLNHTAGGYIFYKSPEYHRITRFRPNGVPMDRPGHYVYLRDDESGDYWSVSWQPSKNNSDRTRKLSVFSYLEFSFHQIAMDNQNFQMSMYASGSSYEDGIIECDLFYEEFGYQFFTADFTPDSYDCLRDKFIGSYRTEDNPIGVEPFKRQQRAWKQPLRRSAQTAGSEARRRSACDFPSGRGYQGKWKENPCQICKRSGGRPCL